MILSNNRTKFIIYLIVFFLSNSLVFAQDSLKTTYLQKKVFSDNDFKNWYHKDMVEDTIPGISLDKAYRELLVNKKGKEVIVAVLDTKLDIHHEDLKNQIWVNDDEIPNNGIDDDKNGYVDDVNGWDFLSNEKGEALYYANLEYIRIIRKYKSIFNEKDSNMVKKKDLFEFNLYKKALNKLDVSDRTNLSKLDYLNKWVNNFYPNAKKMLKEYFPKEDYSVNQLDSLSKRVKLDSLKQEYFELMKEAVEYNLTISNVNNIIKDVKREMNTTYNVDFNEREISGDNPNDITDSNYGSNIVYDNNVPFQHSIAVTGVLAATRENNLGIQGFSNNIKIMPVVMVASGDEHDKDVALAIRYAVDNGAQIINMSWGKNFSTHEDWVQDAIKYAADNNVLLVKAGGNENRSIDTEKYYPRDYKNDKEIVNNFVTVGASSFNLNKELTASFSNYGKKNIDLFAPGNKMFSTEIESKYEYSSGTSIAAPIVSGIAALIKSYYYNLSAAEIKKILMQSGTSYDIDVRVYQEDDSQKLIPFTDLSKSGKIVNAYNALLLADKISKGKNKK